MEALREEGARELLEFAVHGLMGRATKAEEAELARREAALELDFDGEAVPLRQAAVIQSNEADPDRRAAIEDARLELSSRELDPLLREILERSHALAKELGWKSMRAMCEELSGVDLGRLERQTSAFLDASEPHYEALRLAATRAWSWASASSGCGAPTCPTSSARRRSTPRFRSRGSCRASPTRWPGSGWRAPACGSTWSSGRRRRRARSARRCACPTRCTS